MKFYLAARYSRHEEMRGVRDELEGLGHTVTSRWIEAPEGRYGRGSFTPQQLADDPLYCSDVAARDIADIKAADAMISFTEADGGGKGGRHVELGMAAALGKDLYVVGPREHVFHCIPGVRCFWNWDRLVMYLSQMKAKADTTVWEELEWHYGPVEQNSDPGRMWCYNCGSEVYILEEGYICSGCERQEEVDNEGQ